MGLRKAVVNRPLGSAWGPPYRASMLTPLAHWAGALRLPFLNSRFKEVNRRKSLSQITRIGLPCVSRI